MAEEYSEKAEKILDEAGIKGARETKTGKSFKDILEKIKATYDQIAKDLNSTDEEFVASGQKKYDELKKQGDTYLDYLKNQRAKILESEKKLSKTQKKNLETLNKEISDLTQREVDEKDKSQAQQLIDEYGKTFDKRLQLQEEYNRMLLYSKKNVKAL